MTAHPESSISSLSTQTVILEIRTPEHAWPHLTKTDPSVSYLAVQMSNCITMTKRIQSG